jgi:hypothetical protein
MPSPVLDELIDEVTDRPRTYVDDLDKWLESEGPKRRLIIPTPGEPIQGKVQRRAVDITHGRGSVFMEDGPAAFMDCELARPWLRRVRLSGTYRWGMGKCRVPWRHESLSLLGLRPPRFWGGRTVRGDFAYIDLTRAYAQLWSALTLDMYFRPEQNMLGLGSMEFLGLDEVTPIAAIIHTAGGSIRSTSMSVFDCGTEKVRQTTSWSKILAPDLWGVMMTQLNAVAHEMVRDFQAVLWHTDGGVVPLSLAPQAIRHLAAAWRLVATVRASGAGTIYGPTRWQIGETKTKGHIWKPTRAERLKPLRPETVELVRSVRV